MWVPEGEIADDLIQAFEENLELTKGEVLTQKEDESNGQRRLILVRFIIVWVLSDKLIPYFSGMIRKS